MGRSLRIYVASSWRNQSQPAVVAQLRQHPRKPEVYDFRNPHSVDGVSRGTHGRGFHWREIDPGWQAWDKETFRHHLSNPLCDDGYGSDMAALQWADACLLLLPSGRSAHLEAGFARGRGKPTAIYLQDGEPELMYRMADALIVSPAELNAWVEHLAKYFGECLGDGDAKARAARDKVFRKIDRI